MGNTVQLLRRKTLRGSDPPQRVGLYNCPSYQVRVVPGEIATLPRHKAEQLLRDTPDAWDVVDGVDVADASDEDLGIVEEEDVAEETLAGLEEVLAPRVRTNAVDSVGRGIDDAIINESTSLVDRETAIKALTQLPNVGPASAKKLYDAGYTTPDSVLSGDHVAIAAIIGHLVAARVFGQS